MFEMKAGIELDTIVAEKVMGWIKPPATSILKPMWVEPPLGIVHPELPKFSEKIEDAWLVVDKYSYALQLTQSHGYWKCTMVYKFNERGVGQYISAEASKAPLAICLAALRAIGLEVSHD